MNDFIAIVEVVSVSFEGEVLEDIASFDVEKVNDELIEFGILVVIDDVLSAFCEEEMEIGKRVRNHG